jgi:hypothetical protein
VGGASSTRVNCQEYSVKEVAMPEKNGAEIKI